MTLLLCAAAGLATGLVHFALVAHTMGLWATGRHGAGAALQVLRVAASVAVLLAIGRAGLLPLAAAALGFLGARTIALRWRPT